MDFDQTWYILSPYESGTLLIFKVKGQGHRVKFLLHSILVNTRIKILQWILTKLGTYIVLRRVWNPIDFQGQRSMSPGQICSVQHPCEHSRINILQWILTKLGTYLDLKRIWNPIDFQVQGSQGLILRRGDMPRFALPLFNLTCINQTFVCYENKICS